MMGVTCDCQVRYHRTLDPPCSESSAVAHPPFTWHVDAWDTSGQKIPPMQQGDTNPKESTSKHSRGTACTCSQCSSRCVPLLTEMSMRARPHLWLTPTAWAPTICRCTSHQTACVTAVGSSAISTTLGDTSTQVFSALSCFDSADCHSGTT